MKLGRPSQYLMIFKMLKEEGKIGDDLVNRLMSWRHSLRGVGLSEL